MKMYMDKVAVIVTCYNYGKYIHDALDSVFYQTVPPYRIVVIDDCSQDDSWSVIHQEQSSWAKIGKFFTAYQTPSNGGVAKARNFGLEKCKDADWVIFFDADDKLEANYIQEVLDTAHMAKVDVVYTDMRLFGIRNDPVSFPEFNELAFRSNNICHASALIRCDLFDKIGGYDPLYPCYEDWGWYLDALRSGARFAKCANTGLYYRRHTEARQYQANKGRKDLEARKMLRAKYGDWFFG